jgi:hypothetical protein
MHTIANFHNFISFRKEAEPSEDRYGYKLQIKNKPLDKKNNLKEERNVKN